MEKRKYFLCIDNGLSIGKTAIVDYEGNIINISKLRTSICNKGPFSEIDMMALYDNTADAIISLIRNSGIEPSDIVSVGNSGHGGGIYLVDSDGAPLRSAISSMDARCENLIKNWDKKKNDNYSRTYTNLWNGQALPLLNWLKENEELIYKRLYKVLLCKDWIKYCLTGKYSTDYTDASTAGLLDLHSGSYNQDLYDIFELKELLGKLPEISETKNIIGYITEDASNRTGLKKDTPVINGMVDFMACLSGSGLIDNSTFYLVAGTWGINTAIQTTLSNTPDIMSTVSMPDSSNFLVMDNSPNSAGNLEWFLSSMVEKLDNKMNRKEIYKKIDNNIKKKDLKESGLFYFPFIYRSTLTKKMNAMFYPLNASHDIYDMVMAIYEGVVFSHLMHINNLKLGGVSCNRVVLSGGATNSEIWCQMFSDVLNMEVKVVSSAEAGILGLALYQAISQGIYKNIKEAIENMVKVKSIYRPDSHKYSIYCRRFMQFKKIIELLDS